MADDIVQWLGELGLGQHAQTFAENGIGLDVVARLSDDDLKELGLNLGDRRRVQSAVETLAGAGPTGTVVTEQSPPSSPEAERRQLTVMFCDLVGSTALSTSLDPEDMRDVLRSYQDSCADVIGRYDGYVAKFMGDGVYAYFGWPRAHEDDAERAINAGLDIVRAIAALQRDIAVRVGIATGAVVVGDLIGEGAAEEAAVTGETPNLAARLQEIAEPGQVVIGETTHRLAGVLFNCRELGTQELKGFAEPTPAWVALAALTSESRFEARRGVGLTELVGREEEIDIMERRWRRAQTGEGQVVLVSGEPGIGKSRLVRALEDRVVGDGPTQLRYQCSPYHANSALFPVIEQLEHAARIDAGEADAAKIEKLETLLALSGRQWDETASLFANLLSISTGDRYPALDVTPERLKALTLAALVDQLLGLAERKPVLFVFEDIHWIDPTSRELLDQAVDAIDDAPVLMVITHRPDHTSPWVGRAGVAALTLNRLGRRECAVMAAKVTGGAALSEDVLDQIVVRTDGVPLFVEELTKSVLELDEGAEQSIPTTLQDSLEARLDRLGEAKEIAQIAAVIGREFDHRLFEGIASLSAAVLEDGLDRLVASELVFRQGTPPDARYSFKHALVRDVAYESLLRRRRLELHLGIADCLEARFPETALAQPELIAHHLTEAGEARRAIAAWKRAGERSAGKSANREAMGHFERALEVLASLPESAERDRLELDLQIALGPARMAIFGWTAEQSEECYARALELCRKLDETDELGPVLWGYWLIHQGRKDLEKSRGMVDQLFGLAARTDDPVDLLVAHHAAWGNPYLGDFVNQLDHCDKGLALYDPDRDVTMSLRFGAHDAGVCALLHKSVCEIAMGFPERSADSFQRSITLAQRIKHGPTIAQTMHQQGLHDFIRGDWAAMRSSAESAIAYSENLGFPVFMPGSLAQIGLAKVLLDDDARGIGEILHGIERALKGRAMYGVSGYHMMHAFALAHTGDLAGAEDALAKSFEEIERLNERLWESQAYEFKGDLALRSGKDREADAEANYLKALEIARRQNAKLWELRAATQLARFWIERDRVDDAHALVVPIHGWFTEGFENVDLKKAKALLDELV